ncbi:MAG: cation transporter, partial [Bacilli bacterium]|nr:cation transporter [Bacilli bacterium]
MKERHNKAKIASILGILGNIFLLIIKAIISFITGSKAMLADTFNSASDIFSSVMTYIGNKIASIPQDKDHNLGHGKAEYIYSLLISITMILLALTSFKDSIISLFKHNKYNYSIWLIIICIITIITKLLLYLYTNKISKKYNNILMKANSKDHRNDCIVTTFTLISVILSKYNIYLFDSITGIGISIWIFITGIKIFKESYDVLMDKCIDNNTKDKVLKLIKNYPDIKKIQHFNSTPVGYRYQISFTIFVDGNMSTFDSHS